MKYSERQPIRRKGIEQISNYCLVPQFFVWPRFSAQTLSIPEVFFLTQLISALQRLHTEMSLQISNYLSSFFWVFIKYDLLTPVLCAGNKVLPSGARLWVVWHPVYVHRYLFKMGKRLVTNELKPERIFIHSSFMKISFGLFCCSFLLQHILWISNIDI